jgi:LytS/YehU family sensor histidine kinase
VKHGFADRSGVGTVTIRGRREGGKLVVEVEDSGRGLTDPEQPVGEGIGLSATRRRLEKMYPGQSELILGPGEERGALVRVVLPYRVSGEAG